MSLSFTRTPKDAIGSGIAAVQNFLFKPRSHARSRWWSMCAFKDKSLMSIKNLERILSLAFILLMRSSA